MAVVSLIPTLLLFLGGCDGALLGGPECPEGMVLIPAGTAVVGTDERGPAHYVPKRLVEHGAYCIDRYEYPNQEGERPATEYSWDRANDACRGIRKRLCTSMEWGRACRGVEGRKYVYGNQRDPLACNTPIQGSGPGKGKAPVSVSGAFPRCVTPEGVYDMGGNLSEWVSDPWTGRPEPFNKDAVVDPATWRSIRGGTMWFSTFYGQECMSVHGHHKTNFKNVDDGFRCCADPI